MRIHNWGKYPALEAKLSYYRPEQRIFEDLPWIPRGLGRSYGDASLGTNMVSCMRFNRFLDFDDENGLLYCEAGVTFEDLLTYLLPKGWFPPVTPGTKYVSLGGALAANVHGKNHHQEGAIARYVQSFELLTGSGELLLCSRTQHADLFWATLGGMGLTGMILRIKLQLKAVESAWMKTASIKARNLEEILLMLNEFESDTYSVAWLDCLTKGKDKGRSILLKGEHVRLDQIPKVWDQKIPFSIPKKRKISVPFDFPSSVLNKYSAQLFNYAFYHKQLSQSVHRIMDYDAFFYPLDSIQHWNRIYGTSGFIQYQFVIPKEAGQKGLSHILNYIQQAGRGAFLTVLKLFGEEDEGLISFPMAGYTLAMDFPIKAGLFALLDELDHLVADYGGRVYLAKDARLLPNMLIRMYPQLTAFREVLNRYDPEGNIGSLQAQRLGIR